MAIRTKSKQGRTILTRIVSIFLALLLVGGTLAALIELL
jgi:hypothetical protein